MCHHSKTPLVQTKLTLSLGDTEPLPDGEVVTQRSEREKEIECVCGDGKVCDNLASKRDTNSLSSQSSYTGSDYYTSRETHQS